ncbi:hypothetical protein ACJJTC_016780 [Scirpophaga incertulas]
MSEASENDGKTVLLRKRGALKGVLTKLFNYFDNNKCDITQQMLQIKEERIRETFIKFEKLNLDLIKPSLILNLMTMDAVEPKYLETLVFIKQCQSKVLVQQHEPQQNSTKLPQIDIPQFTGFYFSKILLHHIRVVNNVIRSPGKVKPNDVNVCVFPLDPGWLPQVFLGRGVREIVQLPLMFPVQLAFVTSLVSNKS